MSEHQAGPVKITRPDGSWALRSAYTDDEVRAIIRQGEERPRPLTAEESELANRNRRVAREDLAAMEQWYRAEIKEPLSGSALDEARGGPADHVLNGVTLGGDFWKPVVW